MDLVVHIGLPKTGSTVLQYSVLARVRNTVFVHGSGPPEHVALIKALRSYVRGHDDERRKLRAALHARLIAVLDAHGDHLRDGALIISNENISMLPQDVWRDETVPPARVARRLGEWTRHLGVQRWRVRVVVGVRRQDQWLASRYAESAKHADDFSTADFARRMRGMFDPARGVGCEWLEFDRVAALLRHELGRGNVAVLPAEWLRSAPIDALTQLGRALERDDLVHAYSAERERGAKASRNVLSARPNVWRMRGHDQELQLHDDVQRLIRQWYAASNARLARLLPSADLRAWGYC